METSAANLTAITWGHAINSQAELQNALKSKSKKQPVI